ncbi:hypothetical protein K432DRAFT_398541 [Lepidopterella palustris CBS 459.81]|uniref:F-box domain-containing protein n=1 Tax=Lepidopterella palustris CBS 459.81 TaxID=1314670 RepID=A0A8E2J9M5_9PEZI|nr:hypothetical protein K432DRAFT_398541 [Lepidopterella palustris CBS 459.81]
MTLPVELVQMVAEFLPASDKAALALSCHRLYYIIGRSWSPLEGEDKKAFLTILQKDLPDLYLCQACVQFHGFPKDAGPRNGILDFSKPNTACKLKYRMSGFGHDYYMSFYQIHLVMNRHFFWPTHGIPLNALAKAHTFTWPSGFTIKEAWRPKILGNELFLAVTYHFYHKDGNRNMRKYIDGQIFDICRHLRTDYVRPWRSTPRVPELVGCRLEGDSDSNSYECYGETNYCRFCLTDYEVIIRDLGVKGWWIVINTWHQLGSGRTPHDPIWMSFIQPTFRCKPVLREPGSIRRTYENAEGFLS